MQNQNSPGAKPRQILESLTDTQWLCDTDKIIKSQHHTINLFGFLNPLRSTSIGIISENELEWIYSQTEHAILTSPAFDPNQVALIILCGNCRPNPTIVSVCKQHSIALVQTRSNCNQTLDYLHFRLPKLVANREVQHGVFLAVMNVGVFITGTSGVGKSEVAMDLIQRGHQLVADDAVAIYRGEQHELIGECPEALKGHIEIRGLGIINVLKMFGPAAVLNSYRLQLIIDLIDSTNSEVQKVDRLAPSLKSKEILDTQVPCLTMLVAPGRNLSVLVEAAVRDYLLRMSGIDSNAEFLETHNKAMEHEQNCDA